MAIVKAVQIYINQK